MFHRKGVINCMNSVHHAHQQHTNIKFKLQVTNPGCILSIADATQNSLLSFFPKETLCKVYSTIFEFCSSTHKQMGVGIWKSAPRHHLRTKYAAYMYAELSSHNLQYKIDHSPVLIEYTPMYMVWLTFIVSGITQR